jgi:hypothetical protein
MSARKFQKIENNDLSLKLAKIAKLIYKAEEIHEDTGEEPTTDFQKLYTQGGVEGTEIGKGKVSYFALYEEFATIYNRVVSKVMGTSPQGRERQK